MGVSDFMTRMQDLGKLFLRSAKETSESAAEMIEQKTQIQRLAMQVRRLDKERGGLIRQIGAKVYGLHGQGKIRNQDVLVDCQRIDAIIGEIAGLKHEIERIRVTSLEKGIEIPVLQDEAPLTEETGDETPAAVTPAGTTGQQDMAKGDIPKASEGRVEFDEAGEELVTEAEGPSAAGGTSVAKCATPEEPTKGPA